MVRQAPRLSPGTAEGGCTTITFVKPQKITAKDLHITKRKLPHWQIGGSCYFVTFSATNLELTPEARDIIADSILIPHKKLYLLSIAAIMPDHVHLLFRPFKKDDDTYYSLQEILQPIKSSTSHRINRLLGRKGVLWLAETYDRVIRNEKEWVEKYDYITNNAVKSGLVEKPEDYPWLLERDDFLKRY
ncbi:MAG: transposase [Nitrospinota bacterium]